MFTSMFALEMLLKLLACGPLGYIRNPYNIFDGIIVVIRWCPVPRLGRRGLGAHLSPPTPHPPRAEPPSEEGSDRMSWAASPPWDQVPPRRRCQLHAVCCTSQMFLERSAAVPCRSRVGTWPPSWRSLRPHPCEEGQLTCGASAAAKSMQKGVGGSGVTLPQEAGPSGVRGSPGEWGGTV